MENLLDEKLISAKITKIYWERINLYMVVQVTASENYSIPEDLQFYAVAKNNAPKAVFEKKELGGGEYLLQLNVTNTGNKRVLPNSTYKIMLGSGTSQLCRAVADPEIVKSIDDYSRTFPYSNRTCVYTVTFFIEENDDELDIAMIVIAAKETRSGFPRLKIKKLLKIKAPKKYIKDNRRDIIILFYKIFRRIYGKKCKGNLLFMSEQNATLNSNQLAVINRIKQRGLDKEFNIMVSTRTTIIKKYRLKNWIAFVRKLAMAEYIFLDDHVPAFDWLKLNNDTTIVQLWHAGAGFKSSGYSRWGHLGCPAPVSCHRQYDYGIAGSRNIAHFFSEVFGINTDRILPTGMPRMDEYLNESYRGAKVKELYEKYPQCKGKKVMLFAPTYRGKNRKSAYYPLELLDYERLYDYCRKNGWVFLFKLHPWVADPVEISEQYNDLMFDVGDYPNINDLFYITDLLITDYSSNIFEYSLMKRPMLFFAFDKIQYSFSRGFHRDYDESAPGKVCETFDELMAAIENEDYEFEKVQVYIDNQFDYIDTGASDRVIDWILLDKMPQELRSAIDSHDEAVQSLKKLSFKIPKNKPEDELNQGDESQSAQPAQENKEQ
ncbi:MAG: CDP-glycerol glycerophosphotransferase family protein [Clostridiales bacterium]|nr:CDP-glycerol glycerophosphotransferase family protein [Clostridiales bacterium]